MDITTTIQSILTEMHLASSTETLNKALVATIESLRYNRSFETFFNKKKFFLSLVADQPTYPLPIDFLGLIGSVWYSSSSSLTDKCELQDGGVELVEERRYLNETTGAWETGTPSVYGIDDPGKELLLGPVPSTDGAVIHFRYLADLGCPSYSISGGTYTFKKPFSEDTMTTTSTYTNRWLVDGYDAIRSRAIYYLWSRDFGGTPESDMKASKSLIQWQDAMSDLKAQSAKRLSKSEVRRHI